MDHVANIHNSFASFIRYLPVYIIIMPLIRNGSGTSEENEHDGGGGMIAATSASFQHDCQTKLAAQEGVSQEAYPRWITQKFEPDGRLLPFRVAPSSALSRQKVLCIVHCSVFTAIFKGLSLLRFMPCCHPQAGI
jgi:hypothetical protein